MNCWLFIITSPPKSNLTAYYYSKFKAEKNYLFKDNLKKFEFIIVDKEGQLAGLYSSKRNWYLEAFYNQKLSLEGQKV